MTLGINLVAFQSSLIQHTASAKMTADTMKSQVAAMAEQPKEILAPMETFLRAQMSMLPAIDGLRPLLESIGRIVTCIRKSTKVNYGIYSRRQFWASTIRIAT